MLYILIWKFDHVPDIDSKLETTNPIAHSLSYNILNFWRKWSSNNRDTAQRSLPCRFMFGKKWPPIDITRKYDKLCIVTFNRKFDYDDVIKMKNKCHMYCRELSQLQHIKIWEKQVTWLMRYSKTLFTHRRWRSTKLVLFYKMMGYVMT